MLKPATIIFTTLAGLLVCLLPLCSAPAWADDGRRPAPELRLEKKDEAHTWTLRTPNKPGVVLVILSLRDAADKPVEGRQVTGSVWMPEMPMRGYPLDLEFTYEGMGEYSALVQYNHGGLWQIKARFQGHGDQVFEQFFDFTLAD